MTFIAQATAYRRRETSAVKREDFSHTTNRSTRRPVATSGPRARPGRPAAAYRQRGNNRSERTTDFYAQEDWYEATDSGVVRFIKQRPGAGFCHPVTIDEIKGRLAELPTRFTQRLEVVQLSRMTRKRALFPAYGMQWGRNVFLYPIEESLVESYVRPPTPAQIIEAKMFGGVWDQADGRWTLRWTAQSIKDFYLNNVLIHEIGHVNDERNKHQEDRERFANWFAIEYGYRPSRGRIVVR